MANLLKRPAIALATAASLAGCGEISSQEAGLLGGAGVYAAAKEMGASDEVAVLSGVAGYVFGQRAGNPCRTQESGVVTEYKDSRYGTRTRQQQSTAYNCSRNGRPSSSSSPSFQ